MLPKFFFIISILFSLIFTHSSYSQCVDDQKRLLLELKNELIFNSSLSRKLVQWNQTDECCKWYGVECDVSGYVVSLQLDYEFIYGGIGDSSSLFSLKYLEKLNLDYNELKPSYFNNYTCFPIPKGIRNLTHLTHLNLSYAGFCGQIPVEMLSLRRLVSLDIPSGYLSSSDTPNFEMLRSMDEPNREMFREYPNSEKLLSLDDTNLEMVVQNLTGLRELYLDGLNITSYDERRKWSHIISSYLPNLTSLSFGGCGLSGPLSKSFWKLHSLSILRLDFNDLSTTVPDLFIKMFKKMTRNRIYK